MTRHLALARQLGAEVITTPGSDVGETLLRLARQHNVTQIVLGKPLENRWARWFGQNSPVDWLIRHSGDIDIHMIRSEEKDRKFRERFRNGSPSRPGANSASHCSSSAVVTAICLCGF